VILEDEKLAADAGCSLAPAPPTLFPMRSTVWLLVMLAACRSPTEIDVTVTTDVPCDAVEGTAILTGGSDLFADAGPKIALSHACAAREAGDNYLGKLVVVPSAGQAAPVEVIVVTGIHESPESCIEAGYVAGPGAGCIVERRSWTFLPDTPLRSTVVMPGVCENNPCSGAQTCTALGTGGQDAGSSCVAVPSCKGVCGAPVVGADYSSPDMTTYTVPVTGMYSIVAIGGAGGPGGTGGAGGAGGMGAQASGQFALTAGEVLTILVGGSAGGGYANSGAGGGGGSFVVGPGNTPLVVGGGGGGGAGGTGLAGSNASLSSSGTAGAEGGGAGGTDGNGGAASTGGGGGGLLTAGDPCSEGGGMGAAESFQGGGEAGDCTTQIPGGFGGGGGGYFSGGGGGGYSGGGGGGSFNGGGGGGGSYVNPVGMSPSIGLTSSAPSVTITLL